MITLVISKFTEKQAKLDEWFIDLQNPIVLVTNESLKNEFSSFENVITFEKFSADYNLELQIEKLHKEKTIDSIIAFDESIIDRVSVIRERLGIKGQHSYSGNAFRNKILMKNIINQAHLPTAKYKQIETVYDIYDFITDVGYPVIIKPIDGLASFDTSKINNEEELTAWLKTNTLKNNMIEEYIDGDIYHCDGIIINGKLKFFTAFKYVNTCLDALKQGGVGDLLIDKNSNLFQDLYNYTKKVLTAMPTPPTTTFHLEVFRVNNNALIFCEIASRTSGALVPDIIKLAYNLDMNRYIARAQAGIEERLKIEESPYLYASFHMPLTSGTLVTKVEYNEMSLPWCVYFDCSCEEGKYYNPTAYYHSYVEFIVKGETENQVMNNLQKTIDYINTNTVWLSTETV